MTVPQSMLPKIFKDQVINLSKKLLNVDKIWLFGSRATGKHHKNSDVDLAFEFLNGPDACWGEFCSILNDEGKILLPLDLIDFCLAPEGLKADILKHGVKIYDKNDNCSL